MAKARVKDGAGREYILTQESVPAIYRLAEERGLSVIRDSVEDRAGSGTQAFVDAFGARTLGAMSNVAEAVANVPGRIANPMLSAALSPALPATPGTPAARRQPQPPQIPPVSLPDGDTLAAMAESPMRALLAGFQGEGFSLSDAYADRVQDRAITKADRPGASFLGDISADTAALVAARAPFRRGAAGGAFDGLVARGAQSLKKLVNPAGAATGAAGAAGQAAGGLGVLARGGARAVEAGLEGAMIAALQDGDPAEMAAVGAGAQVGGSLANTVRDALIGPPGKFSMTRLATATGVGAIALGALYKATPLDDGNLLTWFDDNLDKIVSGALLGIGAGLAGRRGSSTPGTLGGYFPGLADTLTQMPRAALYEVAREAATNRDFERAMLNAHALNPSDSKRFTDIMLSDDPLGNFSKWVQSNERVRRVFNAPLPELADVPVRED